MRVPIGIAGGGYEVKAGELSNQRTRNFEPQPQANQKEKSNYILQSFYGLAPFATNAALVGRGVFQNQGILYRVADTTLYSVDSSGVHTKLGSIPGSGQCIFDAIDAQVTICTGKRAYQYVPTVGVSLITNANIGTPSSCASLNSQMLYDQNSGTSQLFTVSDVGDATSINGLNFGTAEAKPDALMRVAAFKQTAYMMGAETIEPWWDSGTGNPPFSPLQGSLINQGIDAIYSYAYNNDFMFFLGNDRQVHSLTGGAGAVDTVVSTAALAKEFQDYAVTSDAIGFCMKLEGRWYYVLTFPTQNITWVLPIGGEWFEWGSGVTGRIRANTYAKAFGKHIVDDYSSGNLFYLDAETYTDGGSPIIRTRDTAPLHGGLLDPTFANKMIEMNRFEIVAQRGVGNTSGAGFNPVIMMNYSDDGGETWSTERRGKLGQQGKKGTQLWWNNLGRFQERIMRLRTSEPCFISLFNAVAELEACI